MSFLSLKCPKCSKGEIYQSKLKIKHFSNCKNCGLNFEGFDIGDAPAYSVGFLICIIIPLLAIITDVYFTPNLITHIILWFPLTFLMVYIFLLFTRSYFIYKCYKYHQK